MTRFIVAEGEIQKEKRVPLMQFTAPKGLPERFNKAEKILLTLAGKDLQEKIKLASDLKHSDRKVPSPRQPPSSPRK
jgi:hypothetical protein